ncbi:MAG: hypothetical protein K8S20_05895 [Chloroflexi bacterium]|nr:hypothetical protein [Chloroflexota bacterium]
MKEPNQTLTIQPRRITQLLLGAAIVVAVFSFIGQYLTLFPGSFQVHNPAEAYILDNYFILEFKLNSMSNIVVFFTSFILLSAVALLFFLIAMRKASILDRFKRSWLAFALFFLYLSVDTASILPEKYVKFYNSWTNANGWFTFRWGFILAALLILGFLLRGFFSQLEAGFRSRLFTSIGLYYAGLLGVELFSGHYTTYFNPQTLGLSILVFAAELTEFGGLILLINSLLDYIGMSFPEIRFLTRSKDSKLPSGDE